MPWWKGPNHNSSSSSPSSSSSSPKCSSPSLRQRSYLSLAWGVRETSLPRLTRQRKLRHLTDLEVERLARDGSGGGGGAFPSSSSTPVSRSASNLDSASSTSWSSSSPVLVLPPGPQPQPLPLPTSSWSGLGSGSSGCQLPSPRELPGRGEGEETNGTSESSCSLAEPIGERFSSATVVVGSRFTHQGARKVTEHVEAPSTGHISAQYRRVVQDPSAAETIDFMLNIPPRSAPTSGFSSPVLSPRRLSTGDFLPPTYVASQGLQVWSAPEFPPTDMMADFSTQTSPEKIFASPDRSPIYSPTVRSPGLRSKHPSTPPSPLHPKAFPETSYAWHENGGIANSHPLPLPPGAPVPLQPSFTHQSASKVEVSSMTNQWQKGKLIGSGTFGNVYVATNRHTGALCAMKEVNLIPDDPKSAECIKQLQQEIKVLSQLQHPNIVQYYGSEIIEDRFYIYLEYVYPGSINKYVREHCGAITESVVRNFTRHILQGLAYLHSKNTMHRDIKGANLLVDASGVVKLADFGMAKHLSEATAVLSLKGTPYWMAPEVIQAMLNKDMGYDLAVDIWSLGCTIIEMFTGKHPWNGYEGAAAMFKVLRESPQIPETLSTEGKSFIELCFRRIPAQRPTASELLEHPFIKNSRHHDIHGTIQAFTGIKLDATFSPRNRPKAKTDPNIKGKQLTGETGRCHPETSELAASRLSPRSTLEAVPCLSPPHLNQAAQSPPGPISNGSIGVPRGAGKHQPFARSPGKEVLHLI